MPKTVAIIQARMGSGRLYGKTLLPLPSGRTVLEECIWRVREARGVDQVVVAIPDTPECDVMLNFTLGATVVRGPELDVLERFRRAADISGADYIVRVTSDCPVIPPSMIEKVVARRRIHGLSYASNCLPPSWPLGYTCEVFSRGLLIQSANAHHDPKTREHVTTQMRKQIEMNMRLDGDWIAHNEVCPYGNFAEGKHKIRWTLDTKEDYIEIYKAMQAAPNSLDLLETMMAGR